MIKGNSTKIIDARVMDLVHDIPSGHVISIYDQRHVKRDFRTYAISVDPDQPPRLRRRVWSGSALLDNHNINGTYFFCYVNNFIMYRCFQHRIGADPGLHYLQYSKVPPCWPNMSCSAEAIMKEHHSNLKNEV